ncbi:sensor histidine kinase [Dyadobacter psychrotolerans]|uniref:GHKL domain-containing protein n=1 Tax=Dyadobacter psychrotolerans TaxID=2541721 RepID=A0A4R5DGH4_9BACT|nr:histidine kinase [Dyadobacter psychrotolerans]TDE11030.1 GHKL domain-containing protein [Dyadobacter psychrotolerans]
MKLPEIHIEAFFEKGRRAHLFFCLALLVLMVFILSVSQKWKYAPGAILIYSFILGGIYTGRWLCRKWLMNSKWGGLITMLIVVLLGYCIIGLGAYVYFFVPDLPLNHMIESAINITACSFALIFIGFFIAVIRSAIREKMNGLVLAEQKKGSELSLLRSQVSPHFLFNTLNNMYSLSINRPSQMPDLLLKLSELLRYSVYEADQPLVQLKDELEYIRNYIALENIRSADRLSLTINLADARVNVKIAPMLLIVFIENAFKHARNTLENEIQLVVNCKLVNENIYFEVVNTYIDNGAKDSTDKRSSGFGIANVTKRLELLYPGDYELKQTHSTNQFKVELILKAR